MMRFGVASLYIRQFANLVRGMNLPGTYGVGFYDEKMEIWYL